MARPEITGRKSKSRKDRARKQVRNRGPPTHAFSIQEFCDAHRISRSRYFELKKLGLTPVEMKVGHRCLISFESAARWRAEREAVMRQPEQSGEGGPVPTAA
jgi:hypothetical protein